jgi:hypothetical protein
MGPLDVTPGQLSRHDELVRRLTLLQRAEIVGDMVASGRHLARVGLQQRHPGASATLIEWMLVEQLYGDAVARRLRGPRPTR